MRVSDGQHTTQQIASKDSEIQPSDVTMSPAPPLEFPFSDIVPACPERGHVCTGSNNPMAQDTIQASERKMTPFPGAATGKEITFCLDKERPTPGAVFEDPSNEGDLILRMANITVKLLQEFSTRNAEVRVRPATRQQRQLHRFTQNTRKARRWIYRSAQQKALAFARQQIQNLEQNLDGQAELFSAMAGGAGAAWALAQRDPMSVRIPSALAPVMRFLPAGVKRSLSFLDRADLARVLVTLVNCWLSEDGGEGRSYDRLGNNEAASNGQVGQTVGVERISE